MKCVIDSLISLISEWEGRLGRNLSDCVVHRNVVIPASSARNQRNSPQKNALLTIIGMVLALERICLTKRYLSYNGFITCRSFLVTWKGKGGDIHEACNKYSTPELMCLVAAVPVITLSLRGLQRLVWGWQECSIRCETPVRHCIACAQRQLKLCGVPCKLAVKDRFKWPIRDEMFTAQNDLQRQHSVLAVTSASLSTR